MKLYHSRRAPNPERVSFFLRAKGKLDAVEIEEVSIMKGEHKSKEYRSISPFAKVPALQLDDGTVLSESRAICTYFEGIFPDPNLMGTTPKEKAQIEMWDRQIEFMMMMQYAIWFRNSHEMMAPLEVPQLPEAGAKGEKAAKAFTRRLDGHLATHDFVAAERFSIADITLFICCGFARIMKWDPAGENENIGKWYARAAGLGFAG